MKQDELERINGRLYVKKTKTHVVREEVTHVRNGTESSAKGVLDKHHALQGCDGIRRVSRLHLETGAHFLHLHQ